jgi:hypothetical protein
VSRSGVTGKEFREIFDGITELTDFVFVEGTADGDIGGYQLN